MDKSKQIKTTIKIKLIPKSSKNKIISKESNLYRIKVTAPPVDGKANKALINLLSKKLNCAKSNIEITSGKNSRLKTISIKGLTQEEITDLLMQNN